MEYAALTMWFCSSSKTAKQKLLVPYVDLSPSTQLQNVHVTCFSTYQ